MCGVSIAWIVVHGQDPEQKKCRENRRFKRPISQGIRESHYPRPENRSERQGNRPPCFLAARLRPRPRAAARRWLRGLRSPRARPVAVALGERCAACRAGCCSSGAPARSLCAAAPLCGQSPCRASVWLAAFCASRRILARPFARRRFGRLALRGIRSVSFRFAFPPLRLVVAAGRVCRCCCACVLLDRSFHPPSRLVSRGRRLRSRELRSLRRRPRSPCALGRMSNGGAASCWRSSMPFMHGCLLCGTKKERPPKVKTAHPHRPQATVAPAPSGLPCRLCASACSCARALPGWS